MDRWLAPDFVFDGTTLAPGLAVRLRGGVVAETAPAGDVAQAEPIVGVVTMGFVDVQVNGGGGVMLNTDPTLAGMEVIATAHRRFGTVGVMPTVITDAPEVLTQAADAAIAARGRAGLMGLHIEGPHISMTRRGTHSPDFIRPLDDRTIDVVRKVRGADVAVMITLAPEAATPAQIEQLCALGAVVSIGHTDAAAEQVAAALAAGATCATHLFNAMSPMASRAPGAVGAVLDAPVAAGLICDGHHVDDRMIKLAIRGHAAPEQLFLVSDAMATVGGPDFFELYGQVIRLKEGRLVNAEGNLAGAHVTQAQGLARLVQHLEVPLSRALPMVTSAPARAVRSPEWGRLLGRSLDECLVIGPRGDVLSFLSEL